jgi:putative phosphoesterase
MKRIGVISDTHGLMRPEALAALEGSDLIVHAGDIGALEVIEAIQRVAPVFAVRGNVDRDPWLADFPPTQVVEVDGTRLFVLHDLNQLDLDPRAADLQVVIFGHSHEPSVTTRRGVLYLNPGSAGPRRFHLPVTLARLQLGADDPSVEIVPLLKSSE